MAWKGVTIMDQRACLPCYRRAGDRQVWARSYFAQLRIMF